ncbi:MAG TPA: hypothetical protein VFM72_01400, partial [Aequorivita sp.]|nr:hypothetical protein [Aequorivita sp.]
SNFAELSDWDNEAHYFRILKNRFECLDCKENEEAIKNGDSLEMMDSEMILDTLKTNKNQNWEEEVKDGFNDETSTKTSTRTTTITID